MNERIKELAEQAAKGLLSYHAEGDWYLSENEIEKFAELIRADEREACAKLADKFLYDGVTWYIRSIPKPEIKLLPSAIRARGEVK